MYKPTLDTVHDVIDGLVRSTSFQIVLDAVARVAREQELWFKSHGAGCVADHAANLASSIELASQCAKPLDVLNGDD